MESDDYKTTLTAFLANKGYSQAFVQHFIIPMGEAVWSADPVKFNEFLTMEHINQEPLKG